MTTHLMSFESPVPVRSFYEDPRTGEQRELSPQLLRLLSDRELYTNMDWKGYGAFEDGRFDGEPTRDLGVADVAASQRHGADSHAIMFDLDHPARVHDFGIVVDLPTGQRTIPVPWRAQTWVIPTTTEGHNHLYADVDWPWSTIVALLNDWVEAGLVEPGYRDASVNRGKTSLRLPWVRKVVDNTPTHGNTVGVDPF